MFVGKTWKVVKPFRTQLLQICFHLASRPQRLCNLRGKCTNRFSWNKMLGFFISGAHWKIVALLCALVSAFSIPVSSSLTVAQVLICTYKSTMFIFFHSYFQIIFVSSRRIKKNNVSKLRNLYVWLLIYHSLYTIIEPMKYYPAKCKTIQRTEPSQTPSKIAEVEQIEREPSASLTHPDYSSYYSLFDLWKMTLARRLRHKNGWVSVRWLVVCSRRRRTSGRGNIWANEH